MKLPLIMRSVRMKKSTIFLVAIICLAGAAAYSQSLGDLAREEQKRREAVSGQITVIENLSSIAVSPDRETLTGAENTENEDVGFDIDIGDNPVLGSGNAKLILIKFNDYLCPVCGAYVKETFPQILKEYIDTNILKYVVIDNPFLRQHSETAAQAAHCAADQRKYWEIYRLMLTQQNSLGNLSSYARSLNLNISTFENCLATEKYKKRVQNNRALARSLEITSVPRFIIGSVDPRNPRKVKIISSLRGAHPFSNFQKVIDAAIAR